jgi:hypothetical protein
MSADVSGTVQSPKRRWLERIIILLLAAAVAVPFFKLLLVGPFWLVASFPDSPWSTSLILLLLGISLILCVLGARLESPWTVSFCCRLVLMLATISLSLITVELVHVAQITQAVAHDLSAEDYLLMAGALALVLLVTVGTKIALDLRVRYWIVLLIVSVIVLLAPLTILPSILLS